MSLSEWNNYVEDISTEGVWGSDKELHAVATMLDADVWTFYRGRWLVYRPRFTVGEGGKIIGALFSSSLIVYSWALMKALFLDLQLFIFATLLASRWCRKKRY